MKEIILKKATEMFLTLGYKSVTMDDIAAELGISKKTIYQHYANKNDLVEASAMYLFETISCGIDTIIMQGKNSIEEVFAIRSFMMQNLNNEAAAPLHQLQKFFPEIFSTLRTMQFEKVHGCMKSNLQKGVDSGMYRPEINIDFITRIYFTGLSGIKDADIYPSSMYSVNDATKLFLEYHIRGIATPKGLEILEEILAKIK